LEINKGIYQFGPAYAKMLEMDPHPPGSVDRFLLENMVSLNQKTQSYLYRTFTPLEVKYVPGSRPDLEGYLNNVTGKKEGEGEIAGNIIKFCAEIAREGGNVEPENLTVGGTEEEIIRRKTDWCTDLARTACALFQISGFPSRIAYLFDTGRAYSGHAIIEVFWKEKWGAMDPTKGLIYLDFEEKPVSISALQYRKELVCKNEPNPYPEQFREAALSNYFIWEAEKHDFSRAKVNEYYRKILEMAEKGWPGGLRWLFEEDR